MKIEAGKPKVIRGYLRKSARGKRTWREVGDRRTGMRAKKIRAAVPHTCAYSNCPHFERMIVEKTSYIEVTHPDSARRFGSHYVPLTFKYHPDCVPHDVRPLVRFLIPTPWLMTLVTGDTVRSWRFTSVEAWRLAMTLNYPKMGLRFTYDSDSAGGRAYQVGTDDYYSMLEYKPRRIDRERTVE